jgi:molecular chaperone GrpE
MKQDKHEKKEAEEVQTQEENTSKETSDEQSQLVELTDTLKRLQAEFDNYRKRSDKDRTEFAKFANASLIEQMLPVLDSFELAMKNTADKEKFLQGVKIIFAQLYSILQSQGLRPIECKDSKFDPFKHEVLMKEESEKPEDTVLEEFQKGYMLNEKVLRHSKVKISGK